MVSDKRVSIYWQTDFGRWLSEFGVSKILAGLDHDPNLRVSGSAIYQWIRGRTRPDPDRAWALVELSAGKLTIETVYRHRRQLRELRAAERGKAPCRST
jgi:hypothetical protein